MKSISAEEVRARIGEDDNAVLIDTLPSESYAKEHIPGARSAPAKDPGFVERVEGMVASRDAPVIVYCANKECDLSPTAARKLEDAGFSYVLDFEGGLDEWKNAGFEVEAGAR